MSRKESTKGVVSDILIVSVVLLVAVVLTFRWFVLNRIEIDEIDTINFHMFDPMLTDEERDEILESFNEQDKEIKRLSQMWAKMREICDYSSIKFEDYQKKTNLPHRGVVENYKNTYTSPFGYSLSYPDGWVLTIEEINDVDTIFLKKEGLEMPQIAIGFYAVYSTSGALCANLYCDYEGHVFQVQINDKVVSADVVSMNRLTSETDEDITECELNMNFEGFRIRVEHGEYELYKLDDNLYPLNIFASFMTEEEGREVQKILSTLKFD